MGEKSATAPQPLLFADDRPEPYHPRGPPGLTFLPMFPAPLILPFDVRMPSEVGIVVDHVVRGQHVVAWAAVSPVGWRVGAVRTVGFRYYNPATGRYISRDPIGYPNGPNNYLYVRNNPISRIDPLGLREKTKDENVAINRMKDLSKKAKGKNEKFRKKAEEEKDKSMKRSYESLAQSTAKLADGIDAAVGEIERGIEDSPESAKDPAGLKTALTAIVDWSKQDPKDNKGNWSWAGDGKNKRYYTPSAPFLKCSTWVAHIIYEALGLHLNLNEKAWRRYPPKAADWDTGAAGWGKLESTHDYTWKSGDMNQSLGDVISNGPQ